MPQGPKAFFDLDTHGFCLITPPPTNVDFKNFPETERQYYPALAEQVRSLIPGADAAWVFQHELRDEDPRKNGLGPGAGYARFAHLAFGWIDTVFWFRVWCSQTFLLFCSLLF